MNIALINKGKVENVIEADLEFALQLGFDAVRDVTGKPVSIGMLFDGNLFTAPVVDPESERAISIRLSKLEFLNRFTDTELEGIYQAVEVSIPVKIWFDKFKLAEYIDIADPMTIMGLTKLEQGGLIVQGRAAEILQ